MRMVKSVVYSNSKDRTTIIPDELYQRALNLHLPNTEGLVMGQGNLHPKFLMIGEAPGETEVVAKRPFSGKAGAELNKSLAILGITRDDIYLTSTLRSRPYKEVIKHSKRTGEDYLKKDNRPPTKKEMIAQSFLLDYELLHVDTNLIVTIGSTSLHRVYDFHAQIGQLHGQFLKNQAVQIWLPTQHQFVPSEKKFTIFPTFHPAAVFYNRQLAAAMHDDLLKLRDYLNKEANR